MKKLYLIKNISLLLSFSICLSCTRESTKDKISSEKRDVNETKTHPRKTEISQSYICKSKNSNIVTKKKEFEITLCDGSRKKILRQQLSGKSSDNEDIYRTVNYKEFNKEIDAFEFEVFYAPLNNEGCEWGTSSLFISKVNGAEFEFSGFNDFTESKDKQFYAFVESDEIEVFDISILKKEKNGTLTKLKSPKWNLNHISIELFDFKWTSNDSFNLILRSFDSDKKIEKTFIIENDKIKLKQ